MKGGGGEKERKRMYKGETERGRDRLQEQQGQKITRDDKKFRLGNKWGQRTLCPRKTVRRLRACRRRHREPE
jgi:hypothetical protein